MVSTVNKFRIPSVSVNSISRDFSSSEFPCIKRRDGSIARADLI